jgi:putative inorganic carbon (hco3(-)) transporter
MKIRNLLKPDNFPGAESPIQVRWALLAIILYLVAIVMLIPKDPVFLWAIPFGFVGFMLCLFYQRTLWHLGFFTMPLALQAKEFIGEASLSIPSDVIAAALMLIYGIRLIAHPNIQWRFLKHPISVMLIIWLVWMFVTSFTSTIPLVSFKYFISTLWFVIGFYTLSGIFFREQEQMFRFYSITAPALLAVIVYTLVLHGMHGFTHEASYTISRPFYIEHTVYGGSIALFFPAFFLLSFSHYISPGWKFFWRCASVILFLGIILSYTRASWLGMIAGMGLMFLLYNWGWLKKLIPVVTGVLIIALFYFITQLAQYNFREVNKHDDGLIHRITSIFDTKTDDSNKERINRWTAAINMAKEKPVMGHGPGTYAMLYAPYQESRQLTIISTMHGDQGTTHNEYLLAASEMGVLGAIIIFGLFLATLIRGIKGFFQAPNAQQRLLYAAAICGLTTYYVHSIFNNLLDQEKMAIPMYAMMAMITSLDVFHNTRWINRYMIRWGSEN